MRIIGKKHGTGNHGSGGNDAIGQFPFGIPAAEKYRVHLN